jgi:hypothetical protein
MKLEQLMGRYFRLKQDLSVAYTTYPWRSARIDRLADELSRVEREIAAQRTGDKLVPSELRDIA